MSKKKKNNAMSFIIDYHPIQKGKGSKYDWGYDGTIDGELWKPIKQYKGIPVKQGYWISSDGRVYSQHHHKILEQYIDNKDRPYVKLRCADGKRRNLKVYRLVLEAWVENPMPKLLTEINHRDKNRLNSKLINLGYTTSKYNKQHSHDCSDMCFCNTGLHLEEI